MNDLHHPTYTKIYAPPFQGPKLTSIEGQELKKNTAKHPLGANPLFYLESKVQPRHTGLVQGAK